ncbi:MAG: hypothetical protein PHP45_02845 [Elusimicrobiales bacterium]|nr:hypothetical protein [Elusimicrobiales bacterium]
MTALRLVVFYLACVTAHWWVGTHLSIAGASPSLLLAAAVAVATLGGPLAGHSFAFFCGLYLDFMSAGLFGGYSLAFTVCAYIIWFFKWRMDFAGAAAQMALAFALTVLVGLEYGVIGLVFTGKLIWRGWAYSILMPLFTAIVTPFLFIAAGMLSLDGGKRP